MPFSVEALKELVKNGEIDTVVVGAVDMQARLMGKRVVGRHFVDQLERNGANMNSGLYFMATDIEGHAGKGYDIANWDQGFGDCSLRPDMRTIRHTPWMPNTALVIADPFDKHSGEPLYCSPRVILAQQVERLAAKGLKAKVASEIEFHLFNESYASGRQKGWRQLSSAQPHHRYIDLWAGAGDEPFMRKVRKAFADADIPLEATHSEFGSAQQELNFVPAEPVEMADRHILAKMAIRELALREGMAATFMAKYSSEDVGSSCHIHVSVLDAQTGKSAFWDPNGEYGLSALGRAWTAGMIRYADEYAYFLAPYVNSYKRLQPGSWAPTKKCWTIDNRTGAFRLCCENSANVHVECRIGGADLNPYLAFAALIAAGLAGLEQELELGAPVQGNAYEHDQSPELPHRLEQAADQLARSKMLEQALGPRALKHYVHTARLEQAEFEKQVTDWELMRNFDRC